MGIGIFQEIWGYVFICRLDPRIQDVEAFWYKTEIKIIYFVLQCLIVSIVSVCQWFTLTLNFWYLKNIKNEISKI